MMIRTGAEGVSLSRNGAKDLQKLRRTLAELSFLFKNGLFIITKSEQSHEQSRSITLIFCEIGVPRKKKGLGLLIHAWPVVVTKSNIAHINIREAFFP